MSQEPIVAIALLTQTNLDMLKDSLSNVFKVDDAPCFQDLLKALDEDVAAAGKASA